MTRSEIRNGTVLQCDWDANPVYSKMINGHPCVMNGALRKGDVFIVIDTICAKTPLHQLKKRFWAFIVSSTNVGWTWLNLDRDVRI